MPDDERAERLPDPEQPGHKRFSAIYGKGAEVLRHMATAAATALVLTLFLVATRNTFTAEFRVLSCVIGLSAGLVSVVVAAVGRAEHNRTRRLVEARCDEIERKVEAVGDEIQYNRGQYKMRLDSLTGAIIDLTAIVRQQEAERERMTAAEIERVAEHLAGGAIREWLKWAKELRRDLDALGTPDVADLEPMMHLRRIAERLNDAES